MRRLLPRGPGDLVWQIVLFCGAYWLYRLVRGQVFDQSAAAFEHARDIVSLERSLHVFAEPAIQHWAAGTGFLDDAASWMYLNTHFVVTSCTLAFIYLFRNEHFYWIRNMFMVAMGLALVGYVAFPTAPPRLLPELGFVDSVADFTGVSSDASVNALFNPYAA
ncbi:MAG TPA: phosphatase PAP2 family protein, partial [Solirubrobacter sp.]|nr:phosphatase PAP2 family protein [Solirubrobacter sp.]